MSIAIPISLRNDSGSGNISDGKVNICGDDIEIPIPLPPIVL